jgi:hypothetical protein
MPQYTLDHPPAAVPFRMPHATSVSFSHHKEGGESTVYGTCYRTFHMVQYSVHRPRPQPGLQPERVAYQYYYSFFRKPVLQSQQAGVFGQSVQVGMQQAQIVRNDICGVGKRHVGYYMGGRIAHHTRLEG